jgi:NADH-quinone oxidoreductase subunit C
MSKQETLLTQLQASFGNMLSSATLAVKQVTIEVPANQALTVLQALHDEFNFEQLSDLCGVDYSHYGQADWEGSIRGKGFSRAVSAGCYQEGCELPRFAVVYHLLSIKNNIRLRVRVFAEGDMPKVDSVVNIWNSANWYEREAFDLFGILFDGHPDLRRILTDYGFIGHPFRKDFPISGYMEMRYDPEKKRVVYQPVSIEPRSLVPRVIRHDNRFVE